MKAQVPAEILINSTRVTNGEFAEIYEFVLNEELRVIECVRVESLAEGIVFAVDDFLQKLQGVLFELNHVRVNPRVDNSVIINTLTNELTRIGVGVTHPPAPDSIAVCFKPLGEITENVRFHFNENGKFTFLAPKVKLSVISNNPKPKPLPNTYYE